MSVAGLALELIFQSPDLILPLNYALAVVLHMIVAILVVSILDLLQYTITRALNEKKHSITIDALYSLCIGLNVCELTECSPVRC